MQASDIYINTYVSWTLNNNFTYLVIWYELHCLWRVTLLIQIVEKSHCRSRPPHCRILPHILHPLIPRHFHLWYHTIRLCSQTRVYVSVIMTSYSFYRLCQASDQWWSVRVLSGRSQVLLPLNFRGVSCLTTINDTLKSSADLLSSIESKRKVLYREDHTPKSFVSDKLKYFQKAQERDRVKVLHEKLQEASQTIKLARTLINLKRKFPSHIWKDRKSRREKENKRKLRWKYKIKGEAFTTEPGILASRKTHLKRGT